MQTYTQLHICSSKDVKLLALVPLPKRDEMNTQSLFCVSKPFFGIFWLRQKTRFVSELFCTHIYVYTCVHICIRKCSSGWCVYKETNLRVFNYICVHSNLHICVHIHVEIGRHTGAVEHMWIHLLCIYMSLKHAHDFIYFCIGIPHKRLIDAWRHFHAGEIHVGSSMFVSR